jgi:hypothetical protein
MSTFDDFYNNLQTLPKLISDLALSVSEAQRRMDINYIQDLTAFLKLISSFYKAEGGQPPPQPDQLLSLFKAMMPSRYQFTETVVEVRADLQMTTGTQFTGGGSLGINVPVAVTVNASYTKRSATDHRASALIRTVLNAVPADPGVMQSLLTAAAAAPGAQPPDDARYKALADAFSGFENFKNPPATVPARKD